MKYIDVKNITPSPVGDEYTIEKVGEIYRIFVLTLDMKENLESPQDAEQVFGSGSLWIDYPNFELCEAAIMEEFIPFITN